MAGSSAFFSPSSPDILLPQQRQQLVEVYCRFGYGFLASCVYNSLIIIACCVYAFKARKIPDNFNESKFIGVSVYSTVIICLSAIPMYVLAIQIAQMIGALCVTLLANTYLTLGCLYLPKIYAIMFKGKSGESFGTQKISLGEIQMRSTSGIKESHYLQKEEEKGRFEEEEKEVVTPL